MYFLSFKTFILYNFCSGFSFIQWQHHSFVYLLLTQRHHQNDLLKNMRFFCFCRIESRSHCQSVTVTGISKTCVVARHLQSRSVQSTVPPHYWSLSMMHHKVSQGPQNRTTFWNLITSLFVGLHTNGTSVLSTALALAYTVPQIMMVIISGTVQVLDRPNSVC